ncbi:MAG: hypothetical protein QM723_40090 [Myxococcaceae bacterium]
MSSKISTTGSNPALVRPLPRESTVEASRPAAITQPRPALRDGFAERAAGATAKPPVTVSVRGNPLGVVEAAGDLEASAAKLQQQVLSEAKAYASAPASEQASRMSQLRQDFSQWRSEVSKLVEQGQLDSSQVKSFAALTQQAALVQQNLPAGAPALAPADYAKTAQSTLSRIAFEPVPSDGSALIAANPLAAVPSLSSAPSLAEAKAAGIPTTMATIGGKQVEVRKDVAVVFCPGVSRTTDDMYMQQQAALDAGFAPVLADTGSFTDPDVNAAAVAKAIDEAKKLTGNPDAKVVLVGYSQGATNVLDMMRDAGGKYGAERNSVLAIHTVHSAAGGSQLADIAFALGDYLLQPGKPKPEDVAQLKPLETGLANTLGAPGTESVIAAGLSGFRDVLQGAIKVVEQLDHAAQPVLQKVGLGGLAGKLLGKAMLGAAMAGRELSKEIAKVGGPVAEAAANTLAPAWSLVLSNPSRQLLAQGKVGEALQGYVQGGLRSLTTSYTDQLLADPKLVSNLKGVPVLNSPGAVPQSREAELLPPSQRLFYQTFRALGLESDAEVALQNQEKVGKLPTAVNLPPDASGHWGDQGVIVADGTPDQYSAFSPGGWMTSLLTEDRALGLIE